MKKEIEQRKHPIVITVVALAALAALVRLIIKAFDGDDSWGN